MKAVVTTGQGGYEKLEYRNVPMPTPGPGEVIIRVLAAGVNNTDINLRIGWYASDVKTSTGETKIDLGFNTTRNSGGSWEKSNSFPLIQGTDCCGRVISVGSTSDEYLIGSRVLVRPCMQPKNPVSKNNIWLGTDINGAFAQYVKVPSNEVFPIVCGWNDAELGSIPCAFGTAENMLHLTDVGKNHVLIMGASGGVGSAAIQLAKRRGATVIAITSEEKIEPVRTLGADHVFPRDADLLFEIGEDSVDVVIDVVGGPGFGRLFRLLKRSGKCISSGAIAGPIVELDMRVLYLKDITLIGRTAWDEPVFKNLISYIERGEIRPVIANTFALEQIVEAQQAFLQKSSIGKFVLVPPM